MSSLPLWYRTPSTKQKLRLMSASRFFSSVLNCVGGNPVVRKYVISISQQSKKFVSSLSIVVATLECQHRGIRRHPSAHFPRYPFCLRNPLWHVAYLAKVELRRQTPRTASSIWPASLLVYVSPPSIVTPRDLWETWIFSLAGNVGICWCCISFPSPPVPLWSSFGRQNIRSIHKVME